MKYTKKPVTIEAVQYNGSNGLELKYWSNGAVYESPVLEPSPLLEPSPYVQIKTPEGVMTGNVGDWIIKGIKGEFYPCKPDIFAASYSPATDPTPSSTEGLRNDLEELVKQYDETIQKYTDFSNTAYHNMNPKAADMWNHKRDGIVKAKMDIQKLLDKHSSSGQGAKGIKE